MRAKGPLVTAEHLLSLAGSRSSELHPDFRKRRPEGTTLRQDAGERRNLSTSGDKGRCDLPISRVLAFVERKRKTIVLRDTESSGTFL